MSDRSHPLPPRGCIPLETYPCCVSRLAGGERKEEALPTPPYPSVFSRKELLEIRRAVPRDLGVLEVMTAAPLSAATQKGVLAAARGLPGLLRRAHASFNAAKEAVIAASKNAAATVRESLPPATASLATAAAATATPVPASGKAAAAAAAVAALSGRVEAADRLAWLERQWAGEWELWSRLAEEESPLLAEAWWRLPLPRRLLIGKAATYRLAHGLHFEAKLRRRRGRETGYAFLRGGEDAQLYVAAVEAGVPLEELSAAGRGGGGGGGGGGDFGQAVGVGILAGGAAALSPDGTVEPFLMPLVLLCGAAGEIPGGEARPNSRPPTVCN